MEVTDRPGSENYIENFVPSPKDLQAQHKLISESIPTLLDLDDLSVLERQLVLSLTRQGLQNTKFVLIHGLALNLLEQNLRRIDLHFKNKAFGDYLLSLDPDVSVSYRKGRDDFWRNGLTTIPLWKRTLSTSVFTFSCIYMLIVSISTKFIRAKALDIEWMSFANNRESIDYVLIELLDKKNIRTKHLTFWPSLKNRNSFVFFHKKYSAYRIFEFWLSHVLGIKKHQKNVFKRVNELCGLSLPLAFTMSFRENILLIQQFIYSEYEGTLNSVAVFRGGNAAGIWRECLGNRPTVLLPHGTELKPIDHVVYRFIDYYLMPSEGIIENWRNYDKEIETGRFISLGRPYYEVLKSRVKVNRTRRTVGIVLTYSSDVRTKQFVLDILASFARYDIKFIVKERPNFKNDLSFLSSLKNVSIWSGDIYGFLSESSLVCAGISDYGILGMTVLDAVSLNIPGLYFTQGANPEHCGFSYHDSMNSFVFKEGIDLAKFISSCGSFEDILLAITYSNNKVRDLLGANEGVIDKTVSQLIRISQATCE